MNDVFSVIVPTYNRLDALQEVLSALDRQENAPPFEIIVVVDGSTDGTGDWLAGEGAHRKAFTVVEQKNRGPAAARNTGIEASTGRWIAFLGDDTVPDSGWLAAHREAHQKGGDNVLNAVIGYTGWHRQVNVTSFLSYINEYGLQFGYALIHDPENVPFNFFYTSNLSFPRALLGEERFDESFPYAAWEDIELGYRLQKKGMRIAYQSKAVTRHNHTTDLKAFSARQEKAGFSAVAFYRLHPELGPFLGLGPDGPPSLPSASAHAIQWRFCLLLQPLPLNLGPLWEKSLRRSYIEGLHRGWKSIMEKRS